MSDFRQRCVFMGSATLALFYTMVGKQIVSGYPKEFNIRVKNLGWVLHIRKMS